MNKFQKYEEIKRYLRTLELTSQEYDRIIRALADALKI